MISPMLGSSSRTSRRVIETSCLWLCCQACPHRIAKNRWCKGFFEHRAGAELLGDLKKLYRLGPAATGHSDDFLIGTKLKDLLNRLDPLLIGHNDIGDYQIELRLLEFLHAQYSIGRFDDDVPLWLQRVPHQFPKPGLVINHQDVSHDSVARF